MFNYNNIKKEKVMIKVKDEFLKDYEMRGYINNKNGYKIKSMENYGVFIKEFGYIILNGEYEVVEQWMY